MRCAALILAVAFMAACEREPRAASSTDTAGATEVPSAPATSSAPAASTKEFPWGAAFRRATPRLQTKRLNARALGQPCASEVARYPDAEPPRRSRRPYDEVLCSPDGRATGAYDELHVFMGTPPDGALVLGKPGPRRGPRIGTEGKDWSKAPTFVSVVDGWLWVRRYTCRICRIELGWEFFGNPASLLTEDLQELQRRLALPVDPLLRTPRDWYEALERGGFEPHQAI